MKHTISALLTIASLVLATGAFAQTSHWDVDPT
jgi:hypothetical protein